MTISIKMLGVITLIAFMVGMLPLPIISIVFSLASVILLIWLYAKVDALGYGTRLLKFNLYQWPVCLVLAVILLLVEFNKSWYQSGLANYLVIAIMIILLVFLAVINYQVAKNLLLIGRQTHNIWFQISGILTKIGAFTLPILVGFLFIFLAQPFFLIACIIYHPNLNSVSSEEKYKYE